MNSEKELRILQNALSACECPACQILMGIMGDFAVTIYILTEKRLVKKLLVAICDRSTAHLSDSCMVVTSFIFLRAIELAA